MQQRELPMQLITRRLALTAAIALSALAAVTLHAQAPAEKAKVADIEVTGQHRGYTNSELYLRLDNDKEMTFSVHIPGDTTEQWHDAFKTLSRITVTYHEVPGEKHPVATAIKAAK
jgi:hypothetical protein